jgi:CheY-like chemotaxis protein
MITRICLIDDDVIVLDATALGLRDAGYAVQTAPGAAAGLDLIQRCGADAIITDMNMPGTSGAQLIAQVRASWPEMPIIAISGSNTADGQSMLDAARALGADALLPKPFRVAQLKDVLDRVLAAKRDAQPPTAP